MAKSYDKSHRHDLYIKNKDRVKRQSREWNSRNQEVKRALTKSNRIKRRKMVLEHYGNKCECCGETVYEFLAIDHINGGGCKEIKSLGGNGTGLYSWLIHNNYPSGYRILCHNCNCSCGAYGYCPHEERIARVENCKTRIRGECINKYGGKCDCCGESNVEFLTIDHPNRDGAAHRRELGVGCGAAFYYWLRKNNWPCGFRVLCYNCNFADGIYGGCPHANN